MKSPMKRNFVNIIICSLLLVLLQKSELFSQDSVTVQWKSSDNLEKTICGQVLADYELDNGDRLLSVEDSFGQIHCFRQHEIISVTKNEEPLKKATSQEMISLLSEEFGSSFKTLSTEHFVIVYNTSEGYAAWSGKLFEMIYDSFERYQKKRNLDLEATDIPLVAVLFSTKKELMNYAAQDGFDASSIVAYFHRMNNRMILYDLSEEESTISESAQKSRSYRQIDQILSRPQAAYNVATIVHEATHQITFNRNMILRSGPFPLWLSEGTSMYFETPDENASKGWSSRGSGKPNILRLKLLIEYFALRPVEPIQNVIREENFMNNADYSYAVSWALFYYLNAKKPKQLVQYINLVRQKPPFSVYSPQERLEDFEAVFGNDWKKFYQDFIRFFEKLQKN